MTLPPLHASDLFLAALFVLANGLLSVLLGLGIERRLFIAALRTVVQLVAVGFVLNAVFSQSSPVSTFAVTLVMIVVAGWEAISRQSTRIQGLAPLAVSTATLFLVGLLSTLYATTAVLGAEPWHAPRYLLPILGMVLGNALTSIALVLETMTAAVRSERAGIEARLALGATPWVALRHLVIRAMSTALLPTINAMAVAGLVTLPGMMSGQILAGADPLEAAKYQIMIMFVLAGSSAFAAVAMAFASVRLLTDERARLRLDRLATS